VKTRLFRAGFKGGLTGQLPRASTTKGVGSTKTVKQIITQGNIKVLFETDNLEYKILCLIIHLIHYKIYISLLS